ncbi:iron-sulfur cluster repair di-iron protein [Brevibacillus sp. NL20B1]|jgi:regulator of cell morphogenesis and NO signaling|uniref:iron-sulfur cluster repair di-iron protein n=1 Tax=Brevibacillus sp. NL20B1 TaxID=2829799 RepID=UPI001B8F5628|nr:iron-sulfur cluster repair di-iron protein [Brevibacillus sp. NL20B1]MBR8661056.1 iron-sulfur cluster repair di-iron protein [Brevibacillus sp. NL20B1]
MGQTFNGSETIGDIVAGFPGASNLLREYQIDFCCGGNRTLSAVLEQQQIDKSAFLARLNQMFQQAQEKRGQDTDWREASLSDLIDHIVQTHHAYLLKELPLLSEFTTKILRVHGQMHPELAQLHKLFHQMKMELEQHLITEEEMVFPLIRKAEQTGAEADISKAVNTIEELEADHSAVGTLLKEMRAVTQDYRLPEGACRTYTLTFQKLEELESDLFEHIHLENNVLFPRVKR